MPAGIGLMTETRMDAVDFVKWDTTNPRLIVWKFPSDQLATWTQLIVNDSQQAWLVHEGIYEGPFESGRHVLSTENLPFISKAIGLPFGGSSPFTSEVWFVSKTEVMGLKWGTMQPMQLMDPVYGVLLPVRAFSQYGIKVRDGRKLLAKLVGTLSAFSADQLDDYFRGLLTARVKSYISELIVDQKIPIFELSTHLDDISAKMPEKLNGIFDEYGIELTRFDLMSVSVPENDASVIELKKILSARAKLQVLGANYRQVRSFDVLDAAAGNEGTAGGFMGMGNGTALGSQVTLGAPTAMGGLMNTQDAQKAPQAGSMAEKIRLLKELGELKSAGILTEEEFNQQKAKILQ